MPPLEALVTVRAHVSPTDGLTIPFLSFVFVSLRNVLLQFIPHQMGNNLDVFSLQGWFGQGCLGVGSRQSDLLGPAITSNMPWFPTSEAQDVTGGITMRLAGSI